MRRDAFFPSFPRSVRASLCALGLAMLGYGAWMPPQATYTQAKKVDFNRDVRPILDKCLSCHGHDPKAIQAGLRLDSRQGAMKVLADGARAIVPGHPEKSELISRIFADFPRQMPPKSSNRFLSTEEKAMLRDWIRQGAEFKQHWAFIKPVRLSAPKVKLRGWTSSPIDAFILARLQAERLKPSPRADKETLLRRVSLDLTGLPPSPQEQAAFHADKSPTAYEKVVDRLLASPRYGERMAMDWLDCARYADSNGYQNDYERYQSRWRDWVIDAFNKNMPYDRFTVEQLGGDLLPSATVDQIVATGFCRNNRLNTEGGAIPEEYHLEYVIDRVQTVSAVWLGLTTGCARCHDHKYDPISQKEFYSLCSYFNNVPETDIGEERPINYPPMIKAPYPEQAAEMAILNRNIDAFGRQIDDQIQTNVAEAPEIYVQEQTAAEDVLRSIPLDARSFEQRKALTRAWLMKHDSLFKAASDRLVGLERRKKKLETEIPTVMVMKESPKPSDMFVRIRGVYDKHGPKVTATTPAFLPHSSTGPVQNRLALAKWLISPENPLTARVTVNRMWERLFGVGLVETSEDFGTRSSFPSHPELLDWLATELIAKQWNLKAMWKELVMSSTYCQASTITPKLLAVDPANRLLARGPRFRLQAEIIRDQAMAAGGFMTEKIGGPSVRPYQPKGVWDETAGLNGNLRNYKNDTGPDLHRRSLYTIWKRTAPPPDMALFDVPSREICSVRRARTDTPLQALTLMNDVTFVEAARGLAQRILREGGPTPTTRIDLGYRLLLGRHPTSAESAILVTAVKRELSRFESNPKSAEALLRAGELPADPALKPAEVAAYTMVASTLLNLDETVTKR